MDSVFEKYHSLRREAADFFDRGDFDAAQERWLKALQLRRGLGSNFPEDTDPVLTLCKLRHDIEQFQYLMDQGILPSSYERVTRLYRTLMGHLSERFGIQERLTLAPEAYRLLGPFYNRTHHLCLPERQLAGTLNPQLDVGKIEDECLASSANGVAVIDNLLTAEALDGLRRMCLESTFWFRVKDSYFGAYLHDGFCSQLLFQVAEEIRAKLPRIVGRHQLQHAWAYKYDSRLSGIKVHADEAAINVNLWLTPDSANLDRNCGGLVVYHIVAPPDWTFEQYNSSPDTVRSLLASKGAKEVRVPYRQNRAVIFNSSRFHATDEFQFADGYLNRRVNLTFMYGLRLANDSSEVGAAARAG